MLELPAADFVVKSVQVYKGEELDYSSSKYGTRIYLPTIPDDAMDMIIVLKTESIKETNSSKSLH